MAEQTHAGDTDRLARQLAFLREVDRLKAVLRRTALIDRSRLENSAEHSWHLAVMVLVLGEYAPDGTDLGRVVRMLLVHDVVEIDAGDTFAYDVGAHADKAARERAAADRVFGLLPADLAAELRSLWDEFEGCGTREARFANALDRFQGLLLNTSTNDGGTWRQHGVTRQAVLHRMEPIRHGIPALWSHVTEAIETAAAEGHLTGGA